MGRVFVMKHPADVSFNIIEDVLFRGSAKDGKNETWRDKPKRFHRQKAIRHLLQAQMIEDGIYPPDGENHDELGLTRAAMLNTLE